MLKMLKFDSAINYINVVLIIYNNIFVILTGTAYIFVINDILWQVFGTEKRK